MIDPTAVAARAVSSISPSSAPSAVHTPASRQRSTALVLFVLLASVYMLVYSGRIESGDSGVLFNAVASFFRFGDFQLDLLMSERLPETFRPDGPLLVSANAEPLQVLLAQPLYALAHAVPGLGLVHTVWVFNVIVSALAGCAIYAYAQFLGYDARTALIGVLAFGLGTIIVPYSKSFFREPLTLTMVLLVGLTAEHTRRSRYRPLWIALLAATAGLMLLTRAPTLFALPALAAIALPSPRHIDRRALTAVLLLIAFILVLLIITNLLGDSFFGGRYDILRRLNSQTTYLITALHSYLFSVGGSVWASSPVALLALPGAWLLVRRRQPRYAIAAALVLLGFAFGYAALSGPHWFGGLSWPPRGVMPAVPFLILAGLPVIERAARARLFGWRLIVIALCAAGLWAQFVAVSLRWGDYSEVLPPEANRFLEWDGGLNTIQYARWAAVPRLWGSIPFDFGWVRADLPWWPWLFALLALVSGWLLIRRRTSGVGALLILLFWFGSVGFALRALHDTDPEYRAGDAELRAMIDVIEAETESEDVVVLSNPGYVRFMLNYGKLHDAARLIALPEHPGDQPSPDQAPRIRADNPDLLLKMQTIPLLYRLAITHDRLWLLENFGPALPWATRPVEHFLAAHYYPLGVRETGPQARLIEFDTTPAPDPFSARSPQNIDNLVFGGQIALLGWELPLGTSYSAGDALPISLVWTASTPPDTDYTIVLFLRSASGAPVAQIDSGPRWGFAPTSQWLPDAPIWDHRAVRLPIDLAPGEYQLWLKIYRFDENWQPVDLPVTSGRSLDDVIGVLPITIETELAQP